MKEALVLRKYVSDRGAADDLVLCTLIRKHGSSYRGVGAKKIVSLAGESLGLLSGGCLEGSIEKCARDRFAELPFVESFSTLAEEDRLLGYQTGCRGVIEILFERVQGDLDLLLPAGPSLRAAGVEVITEGPNLGARKFLAELPAAADPRTFVEIWREPALLVVVGCGADADAYIPLAGALGWQILFLDYRASFLGPHRFPAGTAAECLPIESISARIPEGRRVAVMLMTHNYEADLEILRGLRNHRLGYLGCLGPATRFANLQSDLEKFHATKLSPALASVVHAPAGVYPKNESPEAIALSVVAQVETELETRQRARNWTIVLAAGSAHRFGAAKALAEWNGETLIGHALRTAGAHSGKRVLVVTGGHAAELSPFLNGTLHVFNENWQRGMGGSIACGVRRVLALDPEADSITILPVDQPLVSPAHLANLARESEKTYRAALTSEAANLGPPAVIPRRLFALAASLEGERGLKSALNAAELVGVESASAFFDVDFPQDLGRARNEQASLGGALR